MTEERDSRYILEKTEELLAIDSPTGFTAAVAEHTASLLKEIGFDAKITTKGCVIADLGGEGDPVLVTAHLDTLGGIVKEIKPNGRLRISNLGGLRAATVETENCRVYTWDGKVIEGCMQMDNASAHVNPKLAETVRTFDNMEIVLDEDVNSEEDTRALGITNGCFVCFEPRFRTAGNGYMKARFLDDKLAAAILLAFARMVKEGRAVLNRRVYLFFSTYEEVGHGGKGGLPADLNEVLAVDMGCVGDKLDGSEKKVSICAKDARGPYNHETTSRLVRLAKENGLDYAVDVYLNYGSDAGAAVDAGYDVKHTLIGPGVYASHGYERSHISGAENTLKLLELYLCR